MKLKKSCIIIEPYFIELFNKGLKVSEINHQLIKKNILNPISEKPYSYSTIYKSYHYLKNMNNNNNKS